VKFCAFAQSRKLLQIDRFAIKANKIASKYLAAAGKVLF
jgi:hypothetical protein